VGDIINVKEECMAFDHKPGKGRLFRNDYKKAEKHPDKKGGCCCPECEAQLDVGGWENEDGSLYITLQRRRGAYDETPF